MPLPYFVASAAFAVASLVMGYKGWKITNEEHSRLLKEKYARYKKTDATIVSVQMDQKAETSRSEREIFHGFAQRDEVTTYKYRPIVTYKYYVDDIMYTGSLKFYWKSREQAEQDKLYYEPKQKITVHYDPLSPGDHYV